MDSAGGGLLLIAAIVLSSIIGVLLERRRQSRLETQAYEKGRQEASAEMSEVLAEAQSAVHAGQAAQVASDQKIAADAATIAGLQEQLAELRGNSGQLYERLMVSQTEVAATRARLEEAEKGFAERERLFAETAQQLKREFELLANKVFENQGIKQQTSLQSVLNPFKEQMADFRKRVDEVYVTDVKERATLLTEIKSLQKASDRINAEAENLTRALKGDKKLQGNWGELVLERVLEESGLRKDHEYFLQSSHRNTEGDLKRPDVLIQLPDNKDVVVDSKVSLTAYEQALATEVDEERELYVKQHLLSMRNHVKRLSEQDYDRLPGVRSLDFVLMFVPIESAFTLAMENDARVFTDAFAQRIVIVSPTTLMMTLRIINNVWRYEKQNRNAQEIARRAGALYDKLRGLVEEMDRLGAQLKTATHSYDLAYARLATGKGNLVRQVEHFRELGATVKKGLPTKLVERASADGGADSE